MRKVGGDTAASGQGFQFLEVMDLIHDIIIQKDLNNWDFWGRNKCFKPRYGGREIYLSFDEFEP